MSVSFAEDPQNISTQILPATVTHPSVICIPRTGTTKQLLCMIRVFNKLYFRKILQCLERNTSCACGNSVVVCLSPFTL